MWENLGPGFPTLTRLQELSSSESVLWSLNSEIFLLKDQAAATTPPLPENAQSLEEVATGLPKVRPHNVNGDAGRYFEEPQILIFLHLLPVWPVFGPRHHAHPRDGTEMLPEDPPGPT